MKKAVALLLALVAGLTFWRRRRASSPTPSNVERARTRATEMVAAERSRADRAIGSLRGRFGRGE